MKYRCLVMDHDDTVVRSAETVNYPALLETLKVMRPGQTASFEDFTLGCFRKDFGGFCQERFHFTPEEVQAEFEAWKVYVRTHIPPAYEGIGKLLKRFRAEGGIICVSSHSGSENITRDYQTHFGFVPDRIFGWELGEHKKPHPFALQEIMRLYDLRPEQLLMVDDMKPGYTMAHAAGVPFACAGWSLQFKEMQEFMHHNSDFYFETVEEFGKFLFST